MRSRPSTHISTSAFRHFTDTAARSGMVAPICLFLVLAVTGAGSAPAHADEHSTRGQPTQVYADPALSCAGLTPCYASIQEAVANAGPAPAEIGIFPGTYAESVDLNDMGSAISESPGELSLQALDSTGQPADDGVIVDPDASGGPGTGTAMFAGGVDPFPANLAIRGLEFRSPDNSGLGAIVAGDVVLEDFTAWQTPNSGVFIIATGAVSAARGMVSLNDQGLFIVADQATVVDVQAERNSAIGIGVQTSTSLQASQLEATLNEFGLFLVGCDTHEMNLDNLSAGNNSSHGIVTLSEAQCNPPLSSTFAATQGWDFDALRDPVSAQRGVATGTINAQAIQSVNNGGGGWGVFDVGEINIDSLLATGNSGLGHFVSEASSYTLTQALLSGNESGAFIVAETVWLEQVTADNHTGFHPDTLFFGSGLVVVSNLAHLVAIGASNNNSIGLILSGLPEAALASFDLVDGSFEENLLGTTTLSSDTPLDISFNQVIANANTNGGIFLGDLAVAELRNLTVTNQPIGLAFRVDGELLVETSDIADNQFGINVTAGAASNATIRCSNIRNNIDEGLTLFDGDALDARNNFWGDASGPTHPDHPNGTGDSVADGATGESGDVDYLPFLTAEATAGDCALAGLPTPAHSVPALGLPAIFLLMLSIMGIGRSRLIAGRHRGPTEHGCNP